MPEEIPVEGLASCSVQELSQKQCAGCLLTKQTDHQTLYSTSIWEAGTVEVFDLIGNIISRVSTTTWQENKIDSRKICKGGVLNRGLGLIKQL